MMNMSCLWDVTELESTCLNETTVVNDCVQPQSSLYQFETCVRVTPRSGSDHLGQVGQVVLCSSADAVVIAVENHLMLFSASNRQLVSAVNFESLVECIACNDDGTLLVVAEHSGDQCCTAFKYCSY